MEALAWIATVMTIGITAGTIAAVIYMFIIPHDDNEYLH